MFECLNATARMGYNVTMQTPADQSTMSRRARGLTRGRARFIGWRALLLLIALTAAYGGVKLRWMIYARSEVIRFKGDIANGWHHGTEIYRQADALHYARLHGGAATQPSLHNTVAFRDYFNALRGRYDTLLMSANNDNYGLDYPPARLLIMSSWVWHSRLHAPRPLPPPFDQKLARPLLRLNTTFEALAAVAAFLIVRRVLTLDGSTHAATCGLIAALLVWFNPAVLLDGHVWPQWDVWVLPFYLWACWFGLRGDWLLCGALLALGAMCKGQMLLIAPALMLWPLLRGNWRGTTDLLLGFFAAGVAFVSPWLINNSDASRLLIQLLVPAVLIVLIQRQFSFRWLVFALLVTLIYCGLERGSLAWYFVGFAYGARHLEMMLHIGTIPNLAAVLAGQYGWHPQDTIMQLFGSAVSARELLIDLNVLAILICGVSLALQSRRGDRRILLALALPWLTAACLLPQMHERYLLWAAVATALAAGVSLGTALLHGCLALWASIPIATGLLEQVSRDKTAPALVARIDSWHTVFRNSWPGSSWSVLTLLVVWAYLSLTPSRRAIHAE